jgi:phage baseplate assembly protein gpV
MIMELQEVGKYSVEPFALERILELELIKRTNEHARLRVRGVLAEGEEDQLIEEQWGEKPMKLLEGGTVLFSGAAVDVGVICENGVYYLEAEAVSWTVKLDQTEKKRSFQEKGLSYQSIVNQLAGEAGGKAECNAPEKQVRNLLLEYRETDWEFLKRLASHSNSVLVPDPKAEKPSFAFGAGDGKEYKGEAIKLGDFAVRKKVSHFWELSQAEDISYQEQDAVEYTLRTDHAALEIGDYIHFKGKKLYVREAHIHLKGSVFTCRYDLTTKTGLSAKKLCHPYISGLTLNGTVLKAEGDKVKVHLAIDGKQEEGKAYPFPYATGYSAEGHTGWYVMPEEGDTVQVVFPSEDENDAYAVQSVRQEDTDKTADPKVKYLRTPDGKEIKLDKEEILITAKDNITYIRINEKDGVEIITDKEVQVTSGGSVTVASGDRISMTSTNDFSIVSGKNLLISAADSIAMACKENNLNLETPANGIEMSASKPIKIEGKDAIDLAGDGKLTITSGKAMQVTAKQNLEMASKKKMSLSASSSLEEVCKASSIKMNGSIDLKGTMIKEN